MTSYFLQPWRQSKGCGKGTQLAEITAVLIAKALTWQLRVIFEKREMTSRRLAGRTFIEEKKQGRMNMRQECGRSRARQRLRCREPQTQFHCAGGNLKESFICKFNMQPL